MKKGHWLLTIALALIVAVPAVAQQATLGVYFDAAGTQTTGVFNGGYDVTHTAYLIAFVETVVGGAACKLVMDPQILLINAVYPAGIQIGDLLNGIEIGLTDPLLGYFGQPVRMATLTLFTGANLIANGEIAVEPFTPKYTDVLLADVGGNLITAVGLTSTLTIPVAADPNSWSQVKDLYR
ncbi:MAG: hypothetical protein ACYDIE_12075 [Candidatus Krumholzibacteriia bacterium]